MKKQLYIRLREIREEKGFSQTEIAEYLDLSRQAISNWENGKSSPDIDNIILLSKLYGMSVDELLGANEQNWAKKENDNSKEDVSEKIEEQQQEKNIEDNPSEKVEKSTLEIICLAVILVLSSQFSIVGIVVTSVIAIWMKRTKRNYKIIYLLCVVCFFTSLYNTCVVIEHLFFDWGTPKIEKM